MRVCDEDKITLPEFLRTFEDGVLYLFKDWSDFSKERIDERHLKTEDPLFSFSIPSPSPDLLHGRWSRTFRPMCFPIDSEVVTR